MSFVPKELSGRTFKNLNKTEDKHPDYSGSCTIDGKVYRMVSWHNPPNDKYANHTHSFRFETMEEYERKKAERNPVQNNTGQSLQSGRGFIDDEAPF